MSSTNKTATIELSQYVGTDKPTYLTDYNGDMLKIDNAIAADRDSISTAQNKANTADGKADANKTSIDTLAAQVNGDPEVPGDTGLAGDVNSLQGTVNAITSLIGNGEPTTTDKTIIGAINELAANQGDLANLTTTAKNNLVAAINEAAGGSGSSVVASAVSYDNTASGLTADDVQEAIDELAAAMPSTSAVEVQRATLTAGQTTKFLTFSSLTIGANTLIDIYTDDYDVAPTAVSISGQVVTLTFEAQASNVNVAVKAQN